MTSDLKLLSSYEGPALSTPNRVVMAPMTRNRAGESRVANPMMATYYAQRATAGLLISESVDVSPEAIGYPGTPGLYSAEMVAGWKQVVDAVRDAQDEPAPFFCQLFHTGRVSHTSLRADGTPGHAPSAIQADVQLYTPVGMVQAFSWDWEKAILGALASPVAITLIFAFNIASVLGYIVSAGIDRTSDRLLLYLVFLGAGVVLHFACFLSTMHKLSKEDRLIHQYIIHFFFYVFRFQ